MTVHYDDVYAPARQVKGRIDVDAAMQDHPDTALVTVGDLLSQRSPDAVEGAERRLQKAPRARLARALNDALERRQRVSVWLINREYTRRGVPPAFRLMQVNYDDQEVFLDSLAVDLEWIAARYPNHVAYFNRWRKFTDPRYFHKQARYIFNGSGRGKVPIYKVLKGLSLSTKQQRECHYLRGDKLRNQHGQLDRMLHAVKNELEGRYMLRLHRTRGAVVKLLPEDRLIVNRRAYTWLCANLANWAPSWSAELYNALTGAGDPNEAPQIKPMNRQQADNVMRQVERDLPKKDARPW